jgi:hypothetical protein
MAFTSQQLDALAAHAATADELARALAQDYPTMANKVEQDALTLKSWAESEPVAE